jgi:tetratricopeptide (TPR) repeat protein
MKKFKEFLIAVVLLAVVAGLIYTIHQTTSKRYSKELAKRMVQISPRGGPPETIEGLRQAIAVYEDQIERNVKEGAQTGVYWKILAMRLADSPHNMHNEALEALERAIHFNSEDPTLFYLTGVSAAMVAKSKVGFNINDERERERYFKLSENSYLRALELDVTYTRAMYGLGILYIFELENRASDGIVQIERYLQIRASDISAMFVLARAYFMTENFTRAIETYDRIADRSKNKAEKEEAQKNRDFIMGMMYE